MFYRECGEYKQSYAEDQALYSVKQDRYLLGIFLLLGWVVFPVLADEFTMQAVLIPFLCYSFAALGLNVLTGYAGQVSLGSGAFMGVGAYTCYKLLTLFPDLNLIIAILLSGVFSALIGIVVAVPSLRIKGFYLAVATLASQFFLIWLFEKWAWLYNYNASGAIEVPPIKSFGIDIAGPAASPWTRYYIILALVSIFSLLVMNVMRSRLGRVWKAVRDFDIAAELIGINLLDAKISAFVFSSYIIGVAGATFVFLYKGAAEPNLFDIALSFYILFIIIIGGLGSVLGCFLGAGLLVTLPVIINIIPSLFGFQADSTLLEHINLILIGALIILFLIVESHGLARLWEKTRQKLRLWPFPY